MGAIWGRGGPAGLESPLLSGERDDAESQKSDRGGRKSTGRLPGGENLTGWKRVTGFGASMGQVVRILAENSVKRCQKGKQASMGCGLGCLAGFWSSWMKGEPVAGLLTCSVILSKWLGLFLYL